MAGNGSLDVRPITPRLGAEIHGLDLSVPLGAEVVAAIRKALVTHLVLYFPDQDLTPERQASFAGQFGELTPGHPVIQERAGHPNVLPIDGRQDRASWWHTDVTFLNTPPLGSILHMRELPPVGGDTMFCNLQAAYEGLAEPVRQLCDRLVAWHHDPFFSADVERNGGYEWDGSFHERLYPTSHPVVREHPETGRKGLFVNRQFTRFIEGMSPLESDCLLDLLYRHCQVPEYTCRIRWQVGGVAFWDNRATMHYAVDDYGEALRVAHRVTLRGDRPYGPARPRSDTGPEAARASSLAPR